MQLCDYLGADSTPYDRIPLYPQTPADWRDVAEHELRVAAAARWDAMTMQFETPTRPSMARFVRHLDRTCPGMNLHSALGIFPTSLHAAVYSAYIAHRGWDSLDLDSVDAWLALHSLPHAIDLHRLRLLRGERAAAPPNNIARTDYPPPGHRMFSECVGRLSALTSLDLSECADLLDSEVRHLSSLTSLQHLELPCVQNECTDECMATLGGLVSLRNLCMAGVTEVTDDGIAQIAGLTNMQTMFVVNCRFLTGRAFEVYGGMTGLMDLKIAEEDGGSDAGVFDEHLSHLSALTRLTILVMEGCMGLTGAGFEHFAGMRDLVELDLAGCLELIDLTGLTALTSLARVFLPEEIPREVVDQLDAAIVKYSGRRY
jgi:hypothetical protein